jgi:hypothetical protein
MTAVTGRIATTRDRVSVSERVLGAVFVLVGAVLVYLVLFDQGAVVTLLFGSGSSRTNVLHEFFHDGRHFWNAACH